MDRAGCSSYTLRDELGLTGTKIGCAAGFCGVLHCDGGGGRPTCLSHTAGEVEGKAITTIEGLAGRAEDGSVLLHPVQQAFVDAQVPQCGWCMSGQIMTAAAYLSQNPTPTEEELVAAMAENYCRCGCYHRIRRAVVAAASQSAQADSKGAV
jgi:isoquinoline 1-oxidoreductase alpha subunit